MNIKSEYLDLAIAMAVVFFLASLVVSGLNELVQWALRIRAKFLWAFLHDLIDKEGDKALPAGKAGIANLQGRGNDKRPTVRSRKSSGPAQSRAETRPLLARSWAGLPTPPPVSPATPAADPAAAPEPSTSGQPAHFLQLVGLALDPIDAPQLTGRNNNEQRSGISHVPPTSLAQAFLEVFAEVGRTRVDDGILKLTRDLVSGAGPVTTTEGMFAGLETRQRAALYAALARFVDRLRAAQDQGDETRQDAAGRDISAELASIDGFHPGFTGADDLPGVMAKLIVAIRSARSTGDIAAADAEARKLSSALMHSFPDGFARQRIEVALSSLGDSPMGSTARRLWEAAEGSIDKFRGGLEQWFDSEMTRLSGYYKRSIRVVIATFAILVALTLNIDSLQLARDLWRNPQGRASLIAQADDLVGKPVGGAAPAGGRSGDPSPDAASAPGILAIQERCQDREPPTPKDLDGAAKAYGDVRNCVNDTINKLSGLNVVDRPLWKPRSWAGDWSRSWGWVLHPLGLIGTAAALTLGAPFWFLLLKRLTGLRGDKAPRT